MCSFTSRLAPTLILQTGIFDWLQNLIVKVKWITKYVFFEFLNLLLKTS